MGIYLAEHPFARYAHLIDTTSITLIGQINEELNGQQSAWWVMAASDVSFSPETIKLSAAQCWRTWSSIEVMVWPRVYMSPSVIYGRKVIYCGSKASQN
jgi:hypothetical protein